MDHYDESDDLRQQGQFERRQRNAFLAHPDPQDPDHPYDDEDDIDPENPDE